MKLPGRAWIAIFRVDNRWKDLLAILAGYCNHCPWTADPAQGGGYAFWRCALRRGHDGLHRARNYVWEDDGRPSYVPMPNRQRIPQQPWQRRTSFTRRQTRAREMWHQQQRHKREMLP
jgi:hypothetical protein